jgi:hypothetical protein
VLATLLGGCGDPVCGPADDALPAVTATMGSSEVTWDQWRSSPNNDCGEPDGPISLTLEAQQDGSSFALTLCLPRPDKLSASPVDINEATRVQIIDIFAEVGDGCMASLDRSRAATGTIGFPGLCGDGDGPDGYGLDLRFSAPMTIACDGADPVAEVMQFSGAVAVEAVQF